MICVWPQCSVLKQVGVQTIEEFSLMLHIIRSITMHLPRQISLKFTICNLRHLGDLGDKVIESNKSSVGLFSSNSFMALVLELSVKWFKDYVYCINFTLRSGSLWSINCRAFCELFRIILIKIYSICPLQTFWIIIIVFRPTIVTGMNNRRS